MRKKYRILTILLIVAIFALEIGVTYDSVSRLSFNAENPSSLSTASIVTLDVSTDFTCRAEQISRLSRISSIDAGRIYNNRHSRNNSGVIFDAFYIVPIIAFSYTGALLRLLLPEHDQNSLIVLNYIHKQDGKK